MNFDDKKFERQIPTSFYDVMDILAPYGLIPTLVGGTVRDFLLTGNIGQDWDIELSHSTHSFNKNTWKDLGHDLSKLGKITFLPYEIIRLDVKNTQFEFSPPRIETFDDSKGHSNFVADFNLNLVFSEAVKRRDFSINAMGIRFNSSKEFELLDPNGGIVHLRDKILHYVSEDFEKDPVRFLRAVRFSIKLGFQFSEELHKVLSKMDLEGLSHTYLWSELLKSGDVISMLKALVDWQKKRPELELPLKQEQISHKWTELTSVLLDPMKHETWLIALEWIGVSSETWQKYFSLSSETGQRLARWAKSSQSFIQLKPEQFHGEFEAVRELPEFDVLFDWYFTTKQLLQKNGTLPLLQMIEKYLPDWIHLYRFEVVKDVKHIDPPFRAKYQLWNLCQRL